MIDAKTQSFADYSNTTSYGKFISYTMSSVAIPTSQWRNLRFFCFLLMSIVLNSLQLIAIMFDDWKEMPYPDSVLVEHLIAENSPLVFEASNNPSNTTLLLTDEKSPTEDGLPSRDTNESRLNRPYFILHVGPMKTGTTTIQCALRDLEDTGVLSKHNFKLLETENCRPSLRSTTNAQLIQQGYVPQKNGQATYDNVILGQSWIPGCLMQWKKGNGMPSCWKESYFEILKRSNSSTSFIVSCENIMNVVLAKLDLDRAVEFFKDLTESLEEAGGYRLKVVVTHRRFVEWLPSVQYEANKILTTSRPALQKWPTNQGGRRVETLYDNLQKRRESNDYNSDSLAQVAVDRVVAANEKGVNLSWELINMHEGDVLHNFFCQAFSEDTPLHKALCASDSVASPDNDSSVSLRKNERRHTPVDPLWFDALAVEAKEQGLLRQGLRRRHVIRKAMRVQKQRNLTTASFPTICPSAEVYEELFHQSLAQEQKLLPYFRESRFHNSSSTEIEARKQKMKADHYGALEKVKRKCLYCKVDSPKTLEDNVEWVEFFKNLRRGVD